MIGIIGAMSVEIDRLKQTIQNAKTEIFSGIEFTKGTIFDKDVVIAKCGIGKVFSAICAQTMILKYNPDVIINTGVAGALDSELQIGNIAIGTSSVQYDVDTSAFGDPVGMISGINIVYLPCSKSVSNSIAQFAKNINVQVKQGVIACGDRFLSDKEIKSTLNKNYSAIACDMESGSIAQVCYVNNVPCAIIRAISDTASEGSVSDYTKFLETAADNAVSVTLEFIKNR